MGNVAIKLFMMLKHQSKGYTVGVLVSPGKTGL